MRGKGLAHRRGILGVSIGGFVQARELEPGFTAASFVFDKVLERC
jgi:hypothetical protein